jgi:hypothetical protein
MITIPFKSKEPYFSKEKDGTKPNTVRKLDMSDIRFFQLVTAAHTRFKIGEVRILSSLENLVSVTISFLRET